ncbi:pleiotropic drug resistance protein 1-like [Prunus yedoensis var. nudiflora]|uniref:Pleiotropic drug resistance protein 1-like n=1 Tax=Prunus yedoensis var. nudiflora TaxID=2094558 RepID=A0A314ZPL7_PRUYE|nr:pleiotropic drug resistance protein 1-like [Prunus yedoensis var. nudiflora]
MDTINLYEAGQSLQANGSIWTENGMEVFSRTSMTSNHENDEDDLMWAALERLPTFNRLKKGLLTSSHGEANEVDVRKLGFQERHNLIERLVRDAETGNEKFLMRLRERLDRVGVEVPTLEVRYEHVNIEAEAHVGKRALPSFFNFYINFLEGFLTSLHLLKSRKKKLSILGDLSGIIRPSRITLLLGPPSSGRTTLLLALAGKLPLDVKFSGKVTYNGLDMNESAPWRAAAYISQHDIHNPEMTVRETLAFSSRCQGIGARHEWLAELSRREKAQNIHPDPDIDVFMKAASIEGQKASVVTDYVLKILGLDICADTMVGDAMLRGISGGQRKRVTTGEMLVGPAKVLFMDEISTGLDSSTTFQIVNSLRQFIRILNGTAVIALLQPPPETYELFDDIILLSDGQIVYQGPREHVLEFFESLGFKCPERKGVADFLQEVTSEKDQEQYWANRDETYRFVTVKEFSDAFQSFHVGNRINEELAIPYDKSKQSADILAPKNMVLERKTSSKPACQENTC